MTRNEVLSWYETGLPSRERKMRGHFSTPSELVEMMLDACGYTPERDLTALRVLDPACGSGNFLASVAQRLISSARSAGLSSEAIATTLQRNLWGLDPDPIACFLAEMQVRTVLAEAETRSQFRRRGPLKQLHIHQADGLALPWSHAQSVDLFLTNPPYLAAKNSDLSGYQLAQGRGQVDSYLLFLSLALQVVSPGGWIGLVLPDPVLARTNASRERRRLLEETTIHHIWHLSGVFAAQVGAVVIIAQKRPPTLQHQISWLQGRWLRSKHVCEPPLPRARLVPQALLRAQPGAELRYLLQEVQGTLLGRLHTYLQNRLLVQRDAGNVRSFVPLGELISIRRGEELGKESPQLVDKLPSEGRTWHPVLRGGVDVRRYEIQSGQCWIAREAVEKPWVRYLEPKLLVVKSTQHLQAALDLQGHVALQTLYLLSPDEKTGTLTGNCLNDLYFLLALLNSRLLHDYVRTLYTAYKCVQPQIEQHVLASLPIPIIERPEKARIVERAKLLMHACDDKTGVVELKEQRAELYEQQERAICALYEYALRLK